MLFRSIFGTVVDESLGDQVRVTVIATGFNDANVQQSIPSLTLDRSRSSRSSQSAPKSRSTGSSDGSRSSNSNNDKEFDIPEFLKRSRI